jgi:hypothetical protein
LKRRLTQGRDWLVIRLPLFLRKVGQRLLGKRKSQEPVQAEAPQSAELPVQSAHGGAGQETELGASAQVGATRPLRILPGASRGRTQDAKETQRFRLSDVRQQMENSPPDTSSETEA